MKWFKKKEKYIYLKFADEYFMNGEILWVGNKTYVLVVDAHPKNTLWQRFKRWLGFKVFNPEGHIKVKNYEKSISS